MLVVLIAGAVAVTRPRPIPVVPPLGSGSLGSAATYPAPPTIRPAPSIRVTTTDPTRNPIPTPPAADPATSPPRASGPARVAYATFLLRLNDHRTTVNGLNAALSVAAEAQDTDAVRHAAVDILDFVDAERDWLREHPPAECYAPAHAAANAMLEAYGTAAERFIDWAATGGGLGGLTALGEALGEAQAAADSLASFGQVLEGTTCPA